MVNRQFLAIGLFATLVALAWPGVSAAQEAEEGVRNQNSLGIKVGSHHEDSHDDLLVGLEYTRVLSERLGISVALEDVDSEVLDREYALAVVARVGFAGRWGVLVGPGVEFTEEHGDSEEEFFMRTGIGVGFELGGSGWFLEPVAELDLFRHAEKYFIGAKLGKTF